MNTLLTTNRTTSPNSPLRRPLLVRATATLALLAGLLVSAPLTATAAPAATTDSAGNIVPPGLNAHVDPWCDRDGNGEDGPRVEMLLITEPGDLTTAQRDQYRAELREEARYIDDAFAVAAAETGGARRVRWAHDGACNILIRDIAVDAGSMGHNPGSAMTAVQQKYTLSTNRLYLGFTAKPVSNEFMPTCGQATISGNPLHNDGRSIMFARISGLNGANGRSCHSVDPTYDSTTLHELVHMMGAAYSGAPGSDGGSHCNDGYETLCEAQSDINPRCEGRWVIDCGKDTYFNTNPAPGTWLADPSHWNTANSIFLAKSADGVVPLPTPPAATVTFNTTSPVGNDVVTATVQTIPGAKVQWSADMCAYTGAPTTATADSNGRATYTIQCYDQAIPTVSARVWRTGEKTVTRAKASTTYQSGPTPEITVSGPSSAAPGQQVTLSANTTAPGDWTYQWFAGQEGCGVPVFGAATGIAGKTLTFACDGSTSTDRPVFYAEAVRSQDNFPAGANPFRLTLGTGEPPTGALAISMSGSPMGEGGKTFPVAATMNTAGASVGTWSWTATAGCAVAPDGADRSIAYVTCPSTTNAQVVVSATATATDGRTGTGSHRVTVVPAPTPPPPPPPPVPPTPPVSATATTSDLSALANGNTTTYTVTVKSKTGTPLGGQRVAIEVRPRSGGTYSPLTWVTTAATGTASVNVPATSAGFARAQFTGDSSWSPSVSREVSVSAAITVKAEAWGSKGLRATVKTTGRDPAARVVLALQKKVGNSWKKVASATTNTRGIAQVAMKVKSKTVFRFAASASSTYRADTSPKVTLRP